MKTAGEDLGRQGEGNGDGCNGSKGDNTGSSLESDRKLARCMWPKLREILWMMTS